MVKRFRMLLGIIGHDFVQFEAVALRLLASVATVFSARRNGLLGVGEVIWDERLPSLLLVCLWFVCLHGIAWMFLRL